MRKLILFLLLTASVRLFANPVVMPPIISEFYYNNGDWQFEFYFDPVWQDLLTDFSELELIVDGIHAPFVNSLPLQYDSVIVIDQSCLTETLILDPDEEMIHLHHSWWGNIDFFWYGPYVITGTYQIIGPAEGQSVVRNYFEDGGDGIYIPMLDNTPSIGTEPFVCDSRATFSGYVFDQFNNPVPGLRLSYCPESWYYGVMPPFPLIETDENGYFESEELFPMWHHFKLEKDGFVFAYDTLIFQPDSACYKEYYLNSVDISEKDPLSEISLRAAPNPFTEKCKFMISIPQPTK